MLSAACRRGARKLKNSPPRTVKIAPSEEINYHILIIPTLSIQQVGDGVRHWVQVGALLCAAFLIAACVRTPPDVALSERGADALESGDYAAAEQFLGDALGPIDIQDSQS